MRADRLLKLAEHLETGKLFHETFDFSILSSRCLGMQEPQQCGSVGCAMGEMPYVFPDLCKYDNYGLTPVDIERPPGHTYLCVQEIFDISKDAVRWLFEPIYLISTETRYGIRRLLPHATKNQVAENIRLFIKFYERNHAD